jgi:hypothetical protein
MKAGVTKLETADGVTADMTPVDGTRLVESPSAKSRANGAWKTTVVQRIGTEP